MSFSRRSFLTAAGLTAAAATLPRRAGASGNGPRVLEIFLGGGVSHRDSTWINDPKEWAPVDGWPSTELATTLPSKVAHFSGFFQAHDTSFPSVSQLPFVGTDSYGHGVWMGGAARAKVWNGSQGFEGSAAWSRMRLLAMRTPSDGHLVATHYAATGLAPGRGTASSLGARAQFLTGIGALPTAWLLETGGPGDPTAGWLDTGVFGSAYAPFVVPIWQRDFLDVLSQRPSRPADPLLEMYANQFRDRLTDTTQGTTVRSTGHLAYRSALDQLFQSHTIASLLQNFQYFTRAPGEWWVSKPQPKGQLHPNSSWEDNGVLMGIQLAKYLFDQGAKHVAMPGAIINFDTHDTATPAEHALLQNVSLANVLDALADPNIGLDLSDTLVLLTTEFGRVHDWKDDHQTPPAKPFGQVPDNHHETAYATVLIGGPVNGLSIGGSISGITSQGTAAVNNPAASKNFAWGGFGDRGTQPIHLHAAVMHWMGMTGIGGPYSFTAGEFGLVPGGQPSLSALLSTVFG